MIDKSRIQTEVSAGMMKVVLGLELPYGSLLSLC